MLTPHHPAELPPELAAFLRQQRLVCLLHATDQGTIFVIKAPRVEIESVQGRVPIGLSYQLYQHPAAPVIRILLTIHDRPNSHLTLECFINVQDSQQRSDFIALANQTSVALLFYDEHLSHLLTKQVGNLDLRDVTEVIKQAEQLLAAIPEERFNFDLAKKSVIQTTSI